MNARLLLGLAAVVIVAASCGGDGGGEGTGLEKTLAYFSPETSVLVVVSTDLESESHRELDDLVRRRTGRGVEDYLREFVEGNLRLSWEDGVKPLLGRDLVVGVDAAAVAEGDFGFVVVFRASSGDDLRDAVEESDRFQEIGEEGDARLYRFGDVVTFAIDDDFLVAAASEESLRATLGRAAGGTRLPIEEVDRALADFSEEALLRVFADAERALLAERVSALRALPWVAALRTLGAAVTLGDGELVVDFSLNADAERVREEDLPLATGPEAPRVLRREGDIVGGNRKQSLTTAFLFRAAEIAFPDSRFVRDVHELEGELGIDFAQEVLRQFDGPSASSVSVDGETFAARSEVRDPQALKALLPRLAPHLPRLVAGLEALRSEGQAILFLLAPDVLVLQSDQVVVSRVDDDLWRVRGLTGQGPDELYFGVLGDVFVVASSPELARGVATEEAVEVEDARGAGVLRVDLSAAPEAARERIGIDVGPVGVLLAWIEASVERLRGQLRVQLR